MEAKYLEEEEMECIFCKIASKEISSSVVYEDDEIFAFRDINPVAPSHILIIPKKHIATINDISDEDKTLLAKMILVAKKIAQDEGFAKKGYRLVLNCEKDGGQEVFHIHLHLIGGRKMKWPPG